MIKRGENESLLNYFNRITRNRKKKRKKKAKKSKQGRIEKKKKNENPISRPKKRIP